MSKNRQETRDAAAPKKPAGKPEDSIEQQHKDALPGAVEHFAPMIAGGAASLEEATASVIAELDTLNVGDVTKALSDRVAELVADPADAADALKEAGVDVEQMIADADKVIVSVPNAFQLTLHSGTVKYAAGAYAMLKAHAEHWFAKAHGVTIVDPNAAPKK